MNDKIIIHLNKLQWQMLKGLVEATILMAPVKDYEVETLCICEMYKRRIDIFTFYRKKGNSNTMRINLSITEAYAIDFYFGDFSDNYNKFIRAEIQPKLPVSKPFESISFS